MKKCTLCDELTTGSVGKAGIHWKIICQRCKDEEDALLERNLEGRAKILQAIEGVVNAFNKGD
jgi:hypothetical protein